MAASLPVCAGLARLTASLPSTRSSVPQIINPIGPSPRQLRLLGDFAADRCVASCAATGPGGLDSLSSSDGDGCLGPRDDDVLPDSLTDALQAAAEATALAMDRGAERCTVEVLLPEFW